MNAQSKTDIMFIASAGFIAATWAAFIILAVPTHHWTTIIYPPTLTVVTMVYITSFRLEKKP